MSQDILFRRTFDFLDAVNTVSDAAEIRSALLKSVKKFGIRSFIVCELPQLGEKPDIHLCDWPEGFLDRYLAQNHFANDPLFRHALRTTDPFVWAEAHWDRSPGSLEQRVMDEAAEYGLHDGFVVPIVGVHGDQSVIGLCGPRLLLNPDERRALHLMCVYAHHAARHLKAGASDRSRAILTGLERDCVVRGVLGERATEISDRLRVSEREVRAAISSACRRLEVATLAEGVAKALLARELSL